VGTRYNNYITISFINLPLSDMFPLQNEKSLTKQEAVRVQCSNNAFVLRKTLLLVFSLTVIELIELYWVDC